VFGKPENESRVTNVVGYVLKDGPADKAGVRAGDRILEIDGQPIKHFEGFVDSVRWAIISSEGETIEMKVERPGEGLKMISIASADAQPTREKTSLLQWVFKRPALKEIGIAGKSTPMVGEVHEHSPAQQAGLLAGDEIIEINGRPVFSIMDVLDTVSASEGKTIQMKVRRESGEEVLSMTPRLPDQRPEDWDRPLTGFVFQELGRSQLAYPGVYEQVSAASRSMVNMIQKLFSPGSEISPAHMSGPVGIGRVYYSLLEQPHPLLMVLWFSVVLNVNLAIMNMLPFPVLDGGHIVMAIGEWVRGKPLQGRLLEAFQTVCALMLFGFLIFVTLKDAGDLFSSFGKKGAEKEEVELKWLPDAARAN
jgi:regulator of sigma E protease